MARMPFYSDPVFMQKAQNLGSYTPASGGPFSATRNAVANSYMNNRNVGLNNTMGMAQAGAGRQNALFGNNMAWQTWQGNFGRASKEVNAQEAFAHQAREEAARRAAERKARRRGRMGAITSIGGSALGSMFGGPVGGAVGGQVGGLF